MADPGGFPRLLERIGSLYTGICGLESGPRRGCGLESGPRRGCGLESGPRCSKTCEAP